MRKSGFAASLVIAAALSLPLMGQASAQSRGNPGCTWGCSYTGSSQDELYLRGSLTEYSLRHGGNAGGSNGGSSNYYGTVNNTYTGPNSSSGANVLNVQNMNDTATTAINSTVTTTTGQSAVGGTQTGAASSNASTAGRSSYQNSSPTASQ
jgi:hypothetical protein